MSKHATARVTIANRLGMHARPAMAFVDLAAIFKSTITVSRADDPAETVDGKSIMQIMMLAATQGTELDIVADGDDAEKACKALVKLVKERFGEE